MGHTMNEAVLEARVKVNAAFEGFIGNDDACYSIKRSLIVALSATPAGELPALSKVFLLSGPPSVGKTELARRITNVLSVPFIRLDGRAVRSREKLFDMIDEALLAQDMSAKRSGMRSGMPTLEYPPFAVFVDEIHLVSERTQEGLLTLLEQDDRTMLLDGEHGRRVAIVRQAAFIFATTKPADLDRAFRSRCIEIQLRRYTAAEVETMVRDRFPAMPAGAVEKIATCSRLVPRQAFTMAQEIEEEILLDDARDIDACVRRVMHGRGIRFANGATRDDLRYLDTLLREGRAVGESILKASLFDVDELRVSEDIEPWLLLKGYMTVTAKGRKITLAGEQFVRDAREIEKV